MSSPKFATTHCCTPCGISDIEAAAQWHANIVALRAHDADRRHPHWHHARANLADGVRRTARRMGWPQTSGRLTNVVEELIDGRGHFETELRADGRPWEVWHRERKGLIESWSESASPVPTPMFYVHTALDNARNRPRACDRGKTHDPLVDDFGASHLGVDRRQVELAQRAASVDALAGLPADVAGHFEQTGTLVRTIVRGHDAAPAAVRMSAFVGALDLDDGAHPAETDTVVDPHKLKLVLAQLANGWTSIAAYLRRDVALGASRHRWTHVSRSNGARPIDTADNAARAWQARYYGQTRQLELTDRWEIPQGATTAAKMAFDKHLSRFRKEWRTACLCAVVATKEFDRLRSNGYAALTPTLRLLEPPYHPSLWAGREKTGGKQPRSSGSVPSPQAAKLLPDLTARHQTPPS